MAAGRACEARLRAAGQGGIPAVRFASSNELFKFQPAELTEHSVGLLHRKLEQLYREFLELAELDLLASEPRRSVGLLLAFRPWVFSLVAARRRVRAGRSY